MRLVLSWMMSIMLVLGSLPVSAATDAEKKIESHRKRFKEAIASVKPDATLGDLLNATSPFMTNQAKSDIRSLLEKHLDKKAPKLELKGNQLIVSYEGQSVTVGMKMKGQDPVWTLNKKEIPAKGIKSPEHLLETTQSLMEKELALKKSALEILFFGEDAHAFLGMNMDMVWPILGGALVGWGVFSAAGWGGWQGLALGAGAGALLGWFTNSHKKDEGSAQDQPRQNGVP